ncbi:ras-related protein Rab-42-like [Sylvia atricapilla]|uniref:ras-related protein Rab-42-like n=1 Tax=Sylvia atricapilla TaxID=48155 RepID=UPI003398E5D2
METVTDSSQDPNPKEHFQFHVIVLGDVAVGKSLLLRCFADRSGGGPGGAATPSPTISVEFYNRTILIPTSKAKLQRWDTAGSGEYPLKPLLGMPRSITRSFYRSAAGVLLVFDLTNWTSFEHIPEWYHEAAGDQPPAFVLVGHKCDLLAEQAMSGEEAGHLTTNLGMAFVETSARSNFNVELAFQTLAGGIQQALG